MTNNKRKFYKLKNITKDMEKILRQIGLGQIEVKVYLALCSLGSASAGEITKKAEINRSNCYDALQRLIEKGLVSFIIKTKRKYFQATNPKKLLDLLKEQKEVIERKEAKIRKILPKLVIKKQLHNENVEARVFEGKKGIKTIFEDILNCKEYWVLGSGGKFEEILGPYFKHFQKKVRERRIKLRLLISKKTRPDIITHASEVRYLPKKFVTLISTIIYSDKLIIISWKKNPTGFLLKDKQIADSYRHYFDFLWKKAETVGVMSYKKRG